VTEPSTTPPSDIAGAIERLYDPEKFGARIIAAMEQAGLTYRTAEARIGVDHATLHRVATGTMLPSVETYLRITDWLRKRTEADPDLDVAAATARLPLTMAKRLEDGLAVLATSQLNMTMAEWDWFSNSVLAWCAELRSPTRPQPSGEGLVEAVARMIDPSKWRVLDGYLADVKRKYKGENAGYDPEAFRDKASLKLAADILALAAHQPPSREGSES